MSCTVAAIKVVDTFVPLQFSGAFCAYVIHENISGRPSLHHVSIYVYTVPTVEINSVADLVPFFLDPKSLNRFENSDQDSNPT